MTSETMHCKSTNFGHVYLKEKKYKTSEADNPPCHTSTQTEN